MQAGPSPDAIVELGGGGDGGIPASGLVLTTLGYSNSSDGAKCVDARTGHALGAAVGICRRARRAVIAGERAVRGHGLRLVGPAAAGGA